VQSAVDAAMAEYVAPKSYTMDLKAMLAGDDFKKDTAARGVVVVKIKRAFDFKASDMDIPLVRSGSSDGYVSVGWAKFGKPLFSTRVIVNEMEPWWQEETVLLVGPEELDAEENLRVQLWDSDRTYYNTDVNLLVANLLSRYFG
jgi:Ca2+-dependent lipid-binding protein